MIAELAAANAAFDVIKQTLANGREIYEAGEALAQYFGLKNEISEINKRATFKFREIKIKIFDLQARSIIISRQTSG